MRLIPAFLFCALMAGCVQVDKSIRIELAGATIQMPETFQGDSPAVLPGLPGEQPTDTQSDQHNPGASWFRWGLINIHGDWESETETEADARGGGVTSNVGLQ